MEPLNNFETDPERIVLAAVFYDEDLLQELTVQPHQLKQTKHAVLLSTFLEMEQKEIPIELPALADYLGYDNLENIGGLTYLSDLATSVITTPNLKYYEQLIVEEYQLREAATIGVHLQHGALDLRSAIEKLEKVEDIQKSKGEGGSIKDALVEMYDDLENADGRIKGVRSGFSDVDKMTGGLEDGDLIIVGARPSVGKTAFAINVGLNAAASPNNLDGAVVGIFSMEMKKKKLVKRMSGAVGNIELEKFKTAQKSFNGDDWRKLTMAMGDIGSRDIEIFDQPSQNLNYIRAEARALRKRNKGRKMLIIIDYLQLIQAVKDTGNRQQEISDISRGLKILAGQIDAPIIALSQLSRGVEQRQDKRPMMSDLRESGAIEQDADIIAFLYREDYYDKETEDQNMIEIIFAKQRDGATGTVRLAFIKEYGKFVSIDWSHRTQGEENEVEHEGAATWRD